MNLLQGMLQEELQNSQHRLRAYQKQLGRLPRGALYQRLVNGRPYWYLERMINGKVVNQYKGGRLPENEIQKFQKAKRDRVEFRKAVQLIKKQIVILERAVGSFAPPSPPRKNHA
jgi:hypothetical protein